LLDEEHHLLEESEDDVQLNNCEALHNMSTCWNEYKPMILAAGGELVTLLLSSNDLASGVANVSRAPREAMQDLTGIPQV
jgi:hypothetical protein